MSTPTTMKIDEVEYVRKDSIPAAINITRDPKYGYYPVGKQVCIRTVTMTNVGILEDVTDTDFVLSNASWIAISGRWSNFINGNIGADEVEPFAKDKLVFVSKGAYVDMTEISGDFSKQK